MIRALYRYHIESLSAVRALRLDTLLNLAVELSCFFQHHHIAHFVTGSIAYWAIGGDRNKPLFFGDLDIVVVTASRDFLFEELTRSGWHVRHKKHGLRIHKPTDRKLSACVFVLIPKGDYADQLDTQITHIPREYLVPTRVRVLDKSIYVASEKYIEAIRPLINKKRSLLMVDKTIIGKTVVAESHCQGART